MAIIIDTENESIDNVIMSDDSTGAGIRIPSVMIGNLNGTELISYLAKTNLNELSDIELNVHFINPHP